MDRVVDSVRLPDTMVVAHRLSVGHTPLGYVFPFSRHQLTARHCLSYRPCFHWFQYGVSNACSVSIPH